MGDEGQEQADAKDRRGLLTAPDERLNIGHFSPRQSIGMSDTTRYTRLTKWITW
jgi:hypothetical protein